MARQSFWASVADQISGKHNDEVQLYAFDMLAGDGDDMRQLPLSVRKANLARLLARRSEGIFIAHDRSRSRTASIPQSSVWLIRSDDRARQTRF